MRIKKFLVFQFQNGEVDTGRDRFDNRGKLIPGLIRLDLHFASVLDYVRVGQDPFAANDNATSGDVAWFFFCPWFGWIRHSESSEDFHDRILHRF